MPPPSSAGVQPPRGKPYIYHGHRSPTSSNRPIVHGGPLTNRRSIPKPISPPPPPYDVSFFNWDPSQPQKPSLPPPISEAARRLSPLARFVLDSFRRHGRWCPEVISDLSKLRRITPYLLTEILRSRPLLHPSLSTRLFNWASKQKGFHHTFASYNALAYALNDSHLPRAVDQIPELMNAQGRQPSEKQLEILVRMHADAGRGLRIYHVYKKMRSKFGIIPRIFLFNRILDGLVRTGHLDLALSVYTDIESDGLKLEAITYTILAKGLCKAGRTDKVVELLEKMRGELCRPDVFAYTAMLKVLAAEKNVDGCLRVWEEMRRDKVEADVMAYSTMISGLCEQGRVEKGHELFEEMKKRGFVIDHAVYKSLVDGFVADGKVDNGCELLKEMVADGYRVDLGIYDSLIGGLCANSRVDQAYNLLQLVVNEGLLPGFATVTPMLAAYIEAEAMDRFFQLVEKIGELNLQVNDHLSMFFTFFLGKSERELKALEVFEVLKRKGYYCIDIYNILIEALYKMKEIKRAIWLFEELKGLKDCKPDCKTYNYMISCYADHGDIIQACSCYNKIKEMSWFPTAAAYCSLVSHLCKIGEINGALTLVKDCLGNIPSAPMEFKYSLTILNACKSKKPEKVIKVLDEMVEQDYTLEDIIYCAVIHGFCKYASSTEVRKVFATMNERKLLSDSKFIVYGQLLNEHLKKMTAALVISGLKFWGLESKWKPPTLQIVDLRET